jgi:hypothetical protein
MKKGWIMSLIALFAVSSTSWSQGSLGDIMGFMFENSKEKVPAEGGKVWVVDGAARIGSSVDENGRFRITAVPVGTYQVKASYFSDTLTANVVIRVDANGIANVGELYILENITIVEGATIVTLTNPLINFGDVGQSRIDALDISQSPLRNNPVDLIVSRNSDIKVNNNGEMIIRGARAGDMAYFIDGIKMQEAKAIPSAAIGGITVYSSAIPAAYGDTTGGVIIMETKGYHDLYRMWKISQTKVK